MGRSLPDREAIQGADTIDPIPSPAYDIAVHFTTEASVSTTLSPSSPAAEPRLRHGTVRNFIGGAFVNADGTLIDVHAPATGEVIARTPLSTAAALDAAVEAAKRALPSWAAMP